MDKNPFINCHEYIKASILGSLLKNFILPFEHPFEVLKTKL